MFCAVTSGGCGGGKHDNFATTDNTENQQNPGDGNSGNGGNGDSGNTGGEVDPTPGDGTSANTIAGIWRIDSGYVMSSGVAYNYISGSASASQFTISVNKNTNDDKYAITLSGNGVEIIEDETGRTETCVKASFNAQGFPVSNVEAIFGFDDFSLIGENTYKSEEYGDTRTVVQYQLVDNSTIDYSMVNNNEADEGGIYFTLKRVN